LLELVPNHPQALYGAGCVAADQNQPVLAQEWLKKAIAINPANASAHHRLAELYIRETDFKTAIELLDKAQAIDPYDLEISTSRGFVLNQLGRTDEMKLELARSKKLRAELDALLAAQSLLVRAPKDLNAQRTIMNWMFTHGKPGEGVRWGESILRDHPFEPSICEAMANHYSSTGQPGLANSYRSMARPK
jgi:Flp pilus assembly protein TadD